MKKILITGGAGFIGSSLADFLVEKKQRVVVVDNFNELYDPSLKRKNISALMNSTLFTLYETDVTDKVGLNAIFEIEKPDVVVHIAGITGMIKSIKEPFEFFHNNVTGTLNVLECAFHHHTGKVVFLSTSSVYGNCKIAAEEGSILSPQLNIYAGSKLIAEELCRQYAQLDKFKVTILRLCTVYGPRQRPNMAIAQFVSTILKDEEITVYGNGEAMRDYLFVDDCVRAIELAIDFPSSFDIFNIGGHSTIRINDLLETLSVIFNKPIKIRNVQNPHEIPEYSSVNINKARNYLGYTPETEFPNGIKQYINWLTTKH
jgi:UDP-glucuronate 4-epimerase